MKEINWKRRQFIRYSSLALTGTMLAACGDRAPESSPKKEGKPVLDKIVYGTNWYAQAEHGGFYQAIATGIYEEYGLDVTIKMGGAQVNGIQLLMSGAIDFFMGGGLGTLKGAEEGIPVVTVAAIFQKDPQVLISHPDIGIKTLGDLKGKPIYVSSGANITYWPFLKAKYGFTDDQKRPYNFTIGPFLLDKNSSQQGYLTSEPLKIEREGKFKPLVFLLADYGYTPYATTIETRREMIENNPDLVQRFVDASIKGWYSYLDNPEPGNQLIKKDNPEMTDELIAYSLEKIKEYDIILSEETKEKGIGLMTEERWKTFFDTMVEAGISKPDTDYQKAFTLDFVGKVLE
ncbi:MULTISPECIES: ABC transporter substrate-binding protein [Spirulina sp. CCY15215]|uniref:ABC transporter substrate-binding protein n=1 Tax=Spirulina sp. CCY15215 TaxID=2767591 RepID=UPI00195159FD|nr:ABC transporter substrate-binding protein [Spirulina major]